MSNDDKKIVANIIKELEKCNSNLSYFKLSKYKELDQQYVRYITAADQLMIDRKFIDAELSYKCAIGRVNKLDKANWRHVKKRVERSLELCNQIYKEIEIDVNLEDCLEHELDYE